MRSNAVSARELAELRGTEISNLSLAQALTEASQAALVATRARADRWQWQRPQRELPAAIARLRAAAFGTGWFTRFVLAQRETARAGEQ